MIFNQIEELINWNGYNDVKDHSERVGYICNYIANLLGLDKLLKYKVTIAGFYHDIGKVYVPDKILNKPSKLSDLEFDQIKKHSLYSYSFLKKLGVDDYICESVLFHHENFDGSGYPDGLKEDCIPKGARILRIADAFDALSNNRMYHTKFSKDEVLKIMEKESYKYDINMLNVFTNEIKIHAKPFYYIFNATDPTEIELGIALDIL